MCVFLGEVEMAGIWPARARTTLFFLIRKNVTPGKDKSTAADFHKMVGMAKSARRATLEKARNASNTTGAACGGYAFPWKAGLVNWQ